MTRTIEATDGAGVVVGTVTAPERGLLALHPDTVSITWDCLVEGCGVSRVGDRNRTPGGAYGTLVEHLREAHFIEAVPGHLDEA